MYRNSKLYDEAKRVLIDKYADDTGGADVDKIYYELGAVLFLEGELEAAVVQWVSLLDKYPESVYATSADEILRELSLHVDMTLVGAHSDIVFEEQLRFSMRLWNYQHVDQKTDWSDLQDPWRAYRFYQDMLMHNPDPVKRGLIYYLQFLLVSGHNSDKFGYKNYSSLNDANISLYEEIAGESLPDNPRTDSFDGSVEPGVDKSKLLRRAFKHECERILYELERVDTDAWRVADGYFRMGVITSGSSFWTGSLKVTEESGVYFQRVLELTPEESFNYRRVFAAFWLGEYDMASVQRK